jgi:hypothetical protein
MAKQLSDKQQALVREYLIDSNMTAAAIRAGYSARSANSNINRIFKPIVLDEVKRKQAELARKSDVKAEEIIHELRVIAGLEQANMVDNGLKFTGSDKIKALELLGKSLAMFTDNLNTNDQQQLAKLDQAQADEALRIANIRLKQG